MKKNPFYFLRIVDADELNRYILNYNRLSGNELPIAYLQNAIVIQFYRGPKAVAGFILSTNEMNKLRYFSYLSDPMRVQLLDDENLSETDFLEITANYKLPGLSQRESRIYYNVMLTQAYQYANRLNKPYLLGGSVIRKVKLIQQELMWRVIYHGPIDEEKRMSVQDKSPLLKIYMIEVDALPWRAVVVLTKRYVIRAIKNAIKTSWQRWFKSPTVPPLPGNRRLSDN